MNYIRTLIAALLLAPLAALHAADTKASSSQGKTGQGGASVAGTNLWHGFRKLNFSVDGRDCLLVSPSAPTAGNPWIWRTEFFGHEPQGDLALLSNGWHVAYIDVQNMYGAPVALNHMDRFYEHLTGQFQLATRPVLEGFSRGGLFAFNWAARHPDRVACLYVDAPVCDFKSWPAGWGRGKGSTNDWVRCKNVYGLDDKSARGYKLNPVDNLAPLARVKIPILSVCGDADEVVPMPENTLLVKERYENLAAKSKSSPSPAWGIIRTVCATRSPSWILFCSIPTITRAMKHTLTLITALLLAPLAMVHAASYHVDSNGGNDANRGDSPAEAWQSLEKVNAITFQPGDKLLLKAGATWTGRLHPKGSGSATNWIVLDRYGEGPKPVIHGGGCAGGAVALVNQQYWSIRNLEITNHGSKEPKKLGILIRNNSVGTLAGIEVRDCHIHDVVGDLTDYRDGKESGGIVFYINVANLSLPSKWDDIRIENNTIHDVARNGILMQSQWLNKPNDPNSSWKGHGTYTPSTNVRITGNILERIGGDGIIPWCVKGATIERNFVRESNNNSLKQGHAAVWPYFCEDVVFQYNEVCETKTKFDGMAFDFDNSNQRCIYQYNYSHDNEGGFLNMCCDGNASSNIARYNISQNDGCLTGSRVFLVHGHGNHGYKVYNNTIYVRNGNPAIFEQGADSSGSSILFQNNIFINAGTGVFQAPKGCRFERNLYFGSGHIADDAKKLLADPQLLSPGSGGLGIDSLAGYKLSPGSPALAGGLLIPGSSGRDYWGNAVSNSATPHLGAYNGSPVQSGKE